MPGQTLYWKMPKQFLGNKVASYGGTLKYVFRYSGTGSLNTDVDVILRVCFLINILHVKLYFFQAIVKLILNLNLL